MDPNSHMYPRSSIRIKILSLIVLTISLALSVVVFIQVQQLKADLLDSLQNKADTVAESQHPILAAMLWRLDFQGLDAVLSGLNTDPDFSYAEIRGADGEVISTSTTQKADNPDTVTKVTKAIVFAPSDLRVGELHIEFSHQAIHAKTKEAILNGLSTYLLTLITTLIVLHFSLRHITIPLERLAGVIKKLAKNNLDVAVPYNKQQDEIGEISRAIEVFKAYAIDRDVLLEELASNKEQLLFQAHYDPLTQLPNRSLAMDRLQHQLTEAKRQSGIVAVLFIDLDDFKKVNDTLGHDRGDELLVQCAERLRNVIRESDTIARLGGDEFVAILGGLKQGSDAQITAEKLIHELRTPFQLDEQDVVISASIGVSVFPEDATNYIDLLKNADSAMYFSKARGRNTYSFYAKEMNEGVERRVAIEKEMSGAIERGEFYVHYHPLIEISSGRIISTEALLRWENPKLGRITPDEFIPIAEQTSLIIKLGEFVLNDALKNTALWRQQGAINLRASVNISPRQFRDPDILDVISSSLTRNNLPPSSLELEITEGVLIDNDEFTNECLSNLSSLGIQIAMDDFGTGFSSLSYLRSHPFNILKVDRSFVNDITHDRSDKELVNASIAMAHALKLKVVAEGVETQEHLNILADMGCDYAQGFLFGKPMSAEDIAKLIAEKR